MVLLTHSCTQMLPVTTADLLYIEASREHVWEQCLVQGHLDSDCKEMWDFNPVTCALSHLLSKIPAYFLETLDPYCNLVNAYANKPVTGKSNQSVKSKQQPSPCPHFIHTYILLTPMFFYSWPL